MKDIICTHKFLFVFIWKIQNMSNDGYTMFENDYLWRTRLLSPDGALHQNDHNNIQSDVEHSFDMELELDTASDFWQIRI